MFILKYGSCTQVTLPPSFPPASPFSKDQAFALYDVRTTTSPGAPLQNNYTHTYYYYYYTHTHLVVPRRPKRGVFSMCQKVLLSFDILVASGKI